MRSMRLSDEDGLVTPVETMYLIVFCMLAVAFLGYLGRLHATGVQVTNAAQSAARAASQASTPAAARAAATDSVARSPLRTRCSGAPHTVVSWSPSPTGAWQGGAVTVAVSCRVRNQALTGIWAPGSRVVTMRDTQPVDRYRR